MPFLVNQPSSGSAGGDEPGILSTLGSLLGGLLGSLLSSGGVDQQTQQAIDQATSFDFYNTMLGQQFLAGALNAIAKVFTALLGTLFKGLAQIVEDLIHGRLRKLLADLLALLANLRNIIAPLIKWLQQLQKIQRQYQMQWMRTIIDIVQRIRKVLVPLRLLHVRWAKKLDADLAGFEGDLGSKLGKIIARQNEIRNALNLVMDPSLILRPGHTLAGLGTMIGAVHGAIGALSWNELMCSVAPVAPEPLLEPWAQTQQRVLAEISRNTGDYAVYRAQRDATLQQYAIDLGTVPIG
jgi:hypothetical protein